MGSASSARRAEPLAFQAEFRYKGLNAHNASGAVRTLTKPAALAAADAVSQEPQPCAPAADAASTRCGESDTEDGSRYHASDLLVDFMARSRGERVALGDLVGVFGDRAFGMMLLVLAIPNVIPIPGLSTVVGLPTILLGLQMLMGSQRPWLPRRLAAATIERGKLVEVLERVLPRIAWMERRLRPRLPHFTTDAAERVAGLMIVVLAAVLCLPIVFGNLPPALAIGLIALGLIEKDGLFVIAGMVSGVLALAFVGAIVFGLGQAILLVLRYPFGW